MSVYPTDTRAKRAHSNLFDPKQQQNNKSSELKSKLINYDQASNSAMKVRFN